jgi:predicted AlkP superfamily pyrophosphatase or phosphodiesterase
MKKKVLIMGLDGLRPDSILVTPNIDKLASRGVYSWNAQTEIQCLSAPCWTSLLTGVHTVKHKAISNDDFSMRDLQYKSISKVLIDWDSQIRCIAHSNWEPIITDIFEKGTLSNSSTGSDKEMAENMCNDIEKGNGDFYFIQLDAIDYAGHRHTYGPNSPKYLKAIEKTDEYVGDLLDTIDSRPSSENWFICLISDHGGLGKTHGRDEVKIKGPKELTIPFIAAGDSIIKGELKPDEGVEIFDVLPTIAKFLGMPPKECWCGKIRGLL